MAEKQAGQPRPALCIPRSAFRAGTGFTLVEMLVTLVLMSLIVLALMAVFNSTQQAFRSSLTQTDILESGRNVMGMMTADLETMSPSSYPADTNIFRFDFYRPYLADRFSVINNINFYAVLANNFTAPRQLYQSLVGSDSSTLRTNVLENFFSLSRQNVSGVPSWVGTGYAVFTTTPHNNGLYSLYRFYMTTNANANPALLFNTFASYRNTNAAVWSHLLDGVVGLTVRPYDPNGLEMTNTYEYNYHGTTSPFTNQNTAFFLQSVPGLYSFLMYSNTVPASVEVELGVLENGTLRHAEGLPSYEAQTNYLFNHVGQVHVFRQRVWIRNVNPAAYQ